jgi:hypothetical protein
MQFDPPMPRECMPDLNRHVLPRVLSVVLGCCVVLAHANQIVPPAGPDAPVVHAAGIFTEPAALALADAIAEGNLDQVRRLAPVTDLSVRGDRRVTLLQWALLQRQPEAMQALIDAGADLAQPGLDGDTVLHTAAQAVDSAYLHGLLAAGADPNAANADTGATPIRNALMAGAVESFHALLAAGADPGRPDRAGNTPLHVAGQINEPARALDLLHAGADPRARNAQGATFQRYLFMTRSVLLNADTRGQRERVEAWLAANGIPLETPAASRGTTRPPPSGEP